MADLAEWPTVLNEYNYFLGDPGYLPHDLQRYDHATTSDVKDFADKYLTDNTCVVVNAVPGNKTIEDTPRAKEEAEKVVEIPTSRCGLKRRVLA